jgi:hypothetical protein
MTTTLPDDTASQLAMAKRMSPFRIWFAAQDPRSPGFWQIQSSQTMLRPNNLVRKGWIVVRAG